MHIRELFKGDIQLGGLPEVYYKLKEAIDNEDTNFDDIGEIIRLDPALTTKLLGIVNSAFYGLSGKVETVDHALSIIGT